MFGVCVELPVTGRTLEENAANVSFIARSALKYKFELRLTLALRLQYSVERSRTARRDARDPRTETVTDITVRS